MAHVYDIFVPVNQRTRDMRLYDFNTYFPDEEACREKFRELRARQGIVCPKCGCTHHYWKASKGQFQCAGCGHRTGLRSGTVMQASKLPFRYWFIAMHLLTATKQTFSSLEVQRQLGHKRYQPVWEMMHKLRSLMGIRDGKYMLSGDIEIDEAFFTTETPVDKKGRMLKAGAGSERKAKVLVMAESRRAENPKPGQKPRKVKHLKMRVIPDLKAATIAGSILSGVDCKKSTAITDASKSHSRFSEMFGRHISRVVEPKDIGKVLPWVHIAIANAKTTIAGTYHGVKAEFLQGYLDEFCYKFNRRYLKESLFERLLNTAIGYKSGFLHRIYNRNLRVADAA